MGKPTYGEMRTRAQRIHDVEVKERVLTGLAVLQDEFGDKWVEKINCDRLDLSSTAQCVLGQVYGEYYDGVAALTTLDDQDMWAEQHGFLQNMHGYEQLDDAWHSILCDRDQQTVE